MFEQVFDPVAGSLGLSALFAALPLATLFVLLGAVRIKAQWASLIALAVALAVATSSTGCRSPRPSAPPWKAPCSASSRSCGSS